MHASRAAAAASRCRPSPPPTRTRFAALRQRVRGSKHGLRRLPVLCVVVVVGHPHIQPPQSALEARQQRAGRGVGGRGGAAAAPPVPHRLAEHQPDDGGDRLAPLDKVAEGVKGGGAHQLEQRVGGGGRG
jgi:hypothetical protein